MTVVNIFRSNIITDHTIIFNVTRKVGMNIEIINMSKWINLLVQPMMVNMSIIRVAIGTC